MKVLSLFDGVACWEQYLKYRHCKNGIEVKE